MSNSLSLPDLLIIHERLIEEFGGTKGVRDIGLLKTALARADSGYYSSILEQAAALWESLTQNHPFVDGNKRVGFAATHLFLIKNLHDLTAESDEIFKFVLGRLESDEFRFDVLLA